MHVDERVGADLRVRADRNRPEQRGTGSDQHVVADRRMPLAAVFSGSTERHVVKHHAAIADLRGLTDHHARPVVDEEGPADARARVDLHARPEARQCGQQARQQRNPPALARKMCDPVDPDGVERQVTEQRLQAARRRGVVLGDRVQVFDKCLEHAATLLTERLVYPHRVRCAGARVLRVARAINGRPPCRNHSTT